MITSGIDLPPKLRKKLELYYEYAVNSESNRLNAVSALIDLLPENIVSV